LLSDQGDLQPTDKAKEIEDIQKKIWTFENALKRSLPSDFAKKLEAFVAGYKSDGKGQISFETAHTQADPCLAQLAIDGDIDAIISGDSDFAMYMYVI